MHAYLENPGSPAIQGITEMKCVVLSLKSNHLVGDNTVKVSDMLSISIWEVAARIREFCTNGVKNIQPQF